MIQIGMTNTLKVKRVQERGVFLDGGTSGDIFLPAREVPAGCRTGNSIDVFVNVDREDQLLATTLTPAATVGQFAVLQVVETTASGAYLDWGLDLDLFVPKSEQLKKMIQGRSYAIYIFVDDKTGRITASTRLGKFLGQTPPGYAEGEEVDLIVYEKTGLGYRAVVNAAHEGMIYLNEVFQPLQVGCQVKGYIKKVRDDHKIDLLLHKPGYQGVDKIAQDILAILHEHEGHMAITDKSEPEAIYALFGISKKTFKKAIGALYKERLIVLSDSGIRLAPPPLPHDAETTAHSNSSWKEQRVRPQTSRRRHK